MNDKWCSFDKTCISHEILAYLMEHPKARDTLDGIVEWWLLERKIKCQTGAVRTALSDLVQRGFILEQKKNVSKSQYELNETMRKQIQTFLKKGMNDLNK